MHSFQIRVDHWLTRCLPAQRRDVPVRSFRFLEEAVELIQGCGLTEEEVTRVVKWVYSRPSGSIAQEVGGTLTTLAALCNALELSMGACGEEELARIQAPEVMDKIRKRQALKEEVTRG